MVTKFSVNYLQRGAPSRPYHLVLATLLRPGDHPDGTVWVSLCDGTLGQISGEI